jgi:outer membrane lipoprotein-sorting protein
MAAIVGDAKIVFPKAKVTTGGMATTVHKLNNSLSSSLLSGFWEALAAITFLLYCVFRSWRWTLAAILPNLVPAAILLGILAIMKTPIKPGVAIVFSIALGIAFINSVYLLQRLRSLVKESGLGIRYEMENALRHEGNPCVITSVCVLAGFATFLLSQFDINKTFGTYMLISLVFGMVGDLAFMPALIRMWPWILENDNESTKEHDMIIELEDKSFLPRAAAAIAALIVALLPAGAAKAAPAQDANKILKSVEQRLESKDEAARIRMKVVESNGSSKERELVIKRKSGANHKVLVRLKAPSDVSGVALLSVSKGGSEDQWIYMPSQKKARRVVAGNKSQRFLDTEFSLEDFSANTYARFENKIFKEERSPSAAVTVIESKAKPGGEGTYSRILTWVDTSTYQLQKSEYYDNGGKLLKTIVFRDYKKYGNAWRAQTVEVRNAQTQRSTVLKIAALKLNAGISDREFTQTALEEAD